MKEYFTDEELQSFIEDLETQELYAPRNLKQQILEQAFPKEETTVSSDAGSKSRKASVLVYRFKIVAGMAAALLMLAVLPTLDSPERVPGTRYEQQEEEEAAKDRMSVNAYLNGKLRQVRRRINDRSDDWNIGRLQEVTEKWR